MKAKYVTLQTRNIPIDVKERAEANAREAGFSSLQDYVRVMVRNLSIVNVPVKIDVSLHNDPEFLKAMKDVREGRVYSLTPNPNLNLVDQILGVNE